MKEPWVLQRQYDITPYQGPTRDPIRPVVDTTEAWRRWIKSQEQSSKK